MNIVENPKIHKELWKRWDELEMTSADIIHDATERGVLITPARISKYKNAIKRDEEGNIISTDFKGSLTVLQLVWVCTRWGITININLGTLTMKNGKPVFIIEPYDELAAIKKLHKVFPNTKVILKDLENGED